MATNKDKDRIQELCLGFMQAAETATSEDTGSRKRAVIDWNRSFYKGAHWTQEEYNYYLSKGIEPIKVNRCRPIVKAILGMNSQNSQMITVEPRKDGNQSVADVLTELIKHAQDTSSQGGEGGEHIYAEMLQFGLVDQEAFIKLEILPDTPGGKIQFKALSSYDCDPDPCSKEYNLNDSGRFFIEWMWIDKDEIDIKYGRQIGQVSGTSNEVLFDYFMDNNTVKYDEVVKKYRYHLAEIWWKEKVEGLIVTDIKTGRSKTTSDKDEISKLNKKSRRYETKKTVVNILHKTLMLDKIVLEDEVNPRGKLTKLPYFRFCPYWLDGNKSGVLDDIIDLNRQENQSRTEILRSLKGTLNSGWKVGGGTEKKKQELADYGSVDGYVVDESNFSGKVEKWEPNSIPAGHFAQSEQLEHDIKVVSGVDDAFLGYETGAKESGRAISLKQQQSQLMGNDIFRNFNRTLTAFGNYVIEVILNNGVYTREEVRAIVSDSTLIDTKHKDEAYRELVGQVGASLPQPSMPMQPNPMMLQQIRPEDQPRVMQSIKAGITGAQIYASEYPRLVNNMDEVIEEYAILKMMDDLEREDLGEYGIRVTTSPSAPTIQMANLMELMAIQDKYQTIPPDIILEASSLPNKDKIIERMKQVQAQQAQMAQQPQMQPQPAA